MRNAKLYSRHTVEAARLLGLEAAQARREMLWTTTGLAERANISRDTLRKVEQGDPTAALRTALEVATHVGVPLVGVDSSQLPTLIRRGKAA